MPRPFKLTAGLWRRFSRYEIRRFGGRPRENATIGSPDEMEQISIVPARGAKLTHYDPWAIWTASHPLSPTNPTPYVELVNLLDALRYEGHQEGVEHDTPGQGVVANLPLTTESCDLILKWCSRWGLPGTLLHRVHQITLAPHGRAIPPFAKMPLPVFKRYFRVSDGWVEVPGYAFTPQPEVLIDQPLRFGLGIPQREPLSELWSTFFPEVAPQEAETFAYPAPLSPEFWRAYGEPVASFIDGALALKYALEAILSRRNNSIKRKADRELVVRGELCLRALEKIFLSSRCLLQAGRLGRVDCGHIATGNSGNPR